MRELNECTAEVFWRSAKRIEARRKTRRRVLGWGISLCLLIALWSVMPLLPGEPAGNGAALNGGDLTGNYDEIAESIPGNSGDCDGIVGNMPGSSSFGSIDSFSFSLTWGCYGISSYNSKTGKLVKTTDATNPEEYITTYQLTDTQKQQIYDLVKDLNVTAYPDAYDPHAGGLASSPPMTLILSVKTDTVQKTITAADIALTFESEDSQGQKFLSVCKAIQDILMETDEWKALPEYEFFYD